MFRLYIKKSRLCLTGFFILMVQGYSSAQSNDSTSNTITLTYDYFHFDKQFADDWHIAGLEYKRETKIGAVLGRLNYGNRLGQSGWQFEGEAYPKFSKKVYNYIGIGYSPDKPVFPEFRGGYSLFVNIPKRYEVEGGVRYLHFDKGIWIGVAGLTGYFGNWYLNARSYLSDNNGFNYSGLLTARRYFGEMNDYAWLQLGTGVTPDDNRNLQLGTNQKLHSTRVAAGIRKSIQKRNLLLFSLGYSRDEYMTDVKGNQFFATIGYGRRF